MTKDEMEKKIVELEKQIKELRSEIDSLKGVYFTTPYEPQRPVPCTHYDCGPRMFWQEIPCRTISGG